MTMNRVAVRGCKMPAAVLPARRSPAGPWMGLLRLFARRISTGQLTIVAPDGGRWTVEGDRQGPQAVLQIVRSRAVRRLVAGGNVGLAEAYIDGDWGSPDLPALLELGARNLSVLERALRGTVIVQSWNRLLHRMRANTRAGSRRNVSAHYDLGNGFYRLWLDPTMSYSSALFTEPGQSLAAAQRTKYRRLAASLDLRPGHRVLEIGCGWGAFAELAAVEHGCRVTAVTLSREQRDYAKARVAGAGLEDKVEIALTDYRDIRGEFDRIASIEMFEAVGEAHWPAYFECLKSRLRPGGLAALQVILIDEERFDTYRRSADFIQRHVFPGGMLPSAGAFVRAAERAGLRVEEAFYFGRDYARTLAAWAAAFQESWPRISLLGFDERFKRLWEYYLAYSEAGFRAGSIDVAQFRLKRG